MSNVSLTEAIKRKTNRLTNHLTTVPVLTLMPHSRCNARCIMCDIWKANHEERTLTAAELNPHLQSIRRMNVQRIVLSGGEPLLHPNLWTLCSEVTRLTNAKITLLSTGLTLSKHAVEVSKHIDNVIISLDGDEERHNSIRQIPNAFAKIKKGIVALREHNPNYPVYGRSVIQKSNFRELRKTVAAARELGLNNISFLPVDVSNDAFNHPALLPVEQSSSLVLNSAESVEFRDLVEEFITSNQMDFSEKFIAESPQKFRRIAQFFLAHHNKANFPTPDCNAPWVSAVVESNGDVMPCFFHKPFGNIKSDSLNTILNSKAAVQFRKNLDVSTDKTCQRCVCTLRLGARSTI